MSGVLIYRSSVAGLPYSTFVTEIWPLLGFVALEFQPPTYSQVMAGKRSAAGGVAEGWQAPPKPNYNTYGN